MKETTDKKAKRNEKKKKKMLAEIELYKLKDKGSEMCDAPKRERKLSNDFDDSSNKEMNLRSEPKPKRQKKDNEQFSTQTVECETQSLDASNTSAYTIQQNNTTLLYGEELAALRQALRERKKQLKNLPRLRLRNAGEFADLSQVTKRTPLFLCDVQHLLMYSQLGQHSPYDPRWATLEKCSEISHTILILVEGASVYDYISSESVCPNLAKMDLRIELVSPFTYGGSIVEEICAVPLSKTQKARLERKFGNLSDAVQSSDKVFKVLRSMFPIYVAKDGNIKEKVRKKQTSFPNSDKFPRTELLLSAWQLVEEGYPLPLQGELSTRYASYVLTKDEYAEVTPHSPMWALDCEMCQTGYGNELTRVSIVNEEMEVVYESLVKPHSRITNYLTQYSGITHAMLKNVTKRLEDVQTDLRELLPPDVILVGQSLNSDLHAMKMMHPYIIDTSVIFNLSGERRRKSKLSLLTATFLNEAIQQGSCGHDSVEDSRASLKLVKLKLSKSPEFGDAVLCGAHTTNGNASNENVTFLENSKEEEVQEVITKEFNLATSLFSHVTSQNKNVSLISSNDVLTEYTPFITAAAFGTEEFTKVECQATTSNAEAIEKTLEVIPKHEFCLTHLTLENDENIANIDQWASQLLKNCPNNSLVIVVLAGSPTSSSNGAAFLQIRRPLLVSPRTGLPITS